MDTGQFVLVIGGSSASRAVFGPDASARNKDRLQRVGLELGASIAAFDATDFDRLDRLFEALSTPVPCLPGTAPAPPKN